MLRLQRLQQKRIVVAGPCDSEVHGVIALLKSKGLSVINGKNKKATDNDLLILALSATQELGWWKYINILRKYRHDGNYQMLAIVPNTIEEVVNRQGICPAVSGNNSLPELLDLLMATVEKWIKNETPSLSVDVHTTGNEMTSKELHAIETFLEGNPTYRKSHYRYRYLVFSRLGFKDSTRFALFIAGFRDINKWELVFTPPKHG